MEMQHIYTSEVIALEKIERFLREVDHDFPIYLSDKTRIEELALKYHDKATLCCALYGENIIAMVSGYTKNTKGHLGYISLVAVSRAFRHRGLASRLIRQFMERGRDDGLSAVHLYTHASNQNAINMYYKLGFEKYHLAEEPRPDDIHFIFYL